jgi:hypothetical protein
MVIGNRSKRAFTFVSKSYEIVAQSGCIVNDACEIAGLSCTRDAISCEIVRYRAKIQFLKNGEGPAVLPFFTQKSG